jgi:hypothetical protein
LHKNEAAFRFRCCGNSLAADAKQPNLLQGRVARGAWLGVMPLYCFCYVFFINSPDVSPFPLNLPLSAPAQLPTGRAKPLGGCSLFVLGLTPAITRG